MDFDDDDDFSTDDDDDVSPLGFAFLNVARQSNNGRISTIIRTNVEKMVSLSFLKSTLKRPLMPSSHPGWMTVTHFALESDNPP